MGYEVVLYVGFVGECFGCEGGGIEEGDVGVVW